MRRRSGGRVWSLVFLVLTTPARADNPPFDRPGIAFATGVIPRGAVAWEQGLPDFQHSSDSGVRTTLYSADTNLRFGLGSDAEIQIGTALYNHQRTETAGVAESATGVGDSSLGIKLALPSRWQRFSWAALATVSFPTGKAPFTAEKPRYDLGTTLNLGLDPLGTAGLLVDFSRFDGHNSYILAPSLNFALSDRLGAYVEAGATYTGGGPDSAVAGGGATWMINPKVQLDLSVDFGLNEQSPDLQGGVGVSVYFE
jgi:hypothetical protein